ncbi:MAG: SprT family zinc-dependent metalloprotease [Chloroflexota bacterium]
MQITLHPEDGVRVAVPVRVGANHVRQFVMERAGWIVRRQLEAEARPRALRFVTGERISFLGKKLRIRVDEVDCARVSVKLEEPRLRINVPYEMIGAERKAAIKRAVAQWYMKRGQTILNRRAAYWGERMDLEPAKVIAKEQRSQWGSCSHDGTLRFNWRIVMAEPELIDYVVVHELLHLRVRNHSPRYRADFARIMPDYRARELRLNEFGRQLSV